MLHQASPIWLRTLGKIYLTTGLYAPDAGLASFASKRNSCLVWANCLQSSNSQFDLESNQRALFCENVHLIESPKSPSKLDTCCRPGQDISCTASLLIDMSFAAKCKHCVLSVCSVYCSTTVKPWLETSYWKHVFNKDMTSEESAVFGRAHKAQSSHGHSTICGMPLHVAVFAQRQHCESTDVSEPVAGVNWLQSDRRSLNPSLSTKGKKRVILHNREVERPDRIFVLRNVDPDC